MPMRAPLLLNACLVSYLFLVLCFACCHFLVAPTCACQVSRPYSVLSTLSNKMRMLQLGHSQEHSATNFLPPRTASFRSKCFISSRRSFLFHFALRERTARHSSAFEKHANRKFYSGDRERPASYTAGQPTCSVRTMSLISRPKLEA